MVYNKLMISTLLRKLGLNSHEVEVYLAVLKAGQIGATELSQVTKINRTTIYSVAKQLVKRGIITEDLGSNKRLFIAKPPQDLDLLLRRQEYDLEEKRHLLQGSMAELEKLAKSAQYSVPKIVFIEEEGVKDYLYRQTDTWNKSLAEVDPTWWGFQDTTLVEDYQDWIDWYWQKANPENIDLKLLTNQTDIEKIMQEKHYGRRQIKFWGEATGFTATTWINGDYVVMIVTREKPHYLVEIYDKTLAHNLRQVFKGIWNSI